MIRCPCIENGKKKMYQLLEKMIRGAEKNEREKVLGLNRLYEKLSLVVYQEPNPFWYLEYDNCRQSCVMSMILKDKYKEFLLDAKERFSKLLKPAH